MWNRFTRGSTAIAGALLTLGVLGATMAGPAGASGFGAAGYQAGNGAWSFRYAPGRRPGAAHIPAIARRHFPG